MPQPLLVFSQSDYLIQVVDTNSHTEWQTVQIQISWLICIYKVCKSETYPGSAGQVLKQRESIIKSKLTYITELDMS